MLPFLNLAAFLPHLGTEFQLELEPGRSVVATLSEAVELTAHQGPTVDGRRPFSLIFVAPAEAVIRQRIHTVQHAVLGRFDLFLVPVGRDGAGVKCEAVFN